MAAMCMEQGLSAWVCYGQVESRFHEVFFMGRWQCPTTLHAGGRAAGAGLWAPPQIRPASSKTSLGRLRAPGRTKRFVIIGAGHRARRSACSWVMVGTRFPPAEASSSSISRSCGAAP